MRKFIVFFMAVMLALPAVAMARFQAGDKEFTLSGSGTSDNDFDNNTFSAEFGLGYFFSDMLEGILRQQAGFIARDPGNDDWNGSTSVGADLNFQFGNWVPFLGATIGYIYGDGVDETWIGSPEAGLKAFVNPTTFIQALVQYQWFFDSADEADENFDDGRFVYSLGIGFRF